MINGILDPVSGCLGIAPTRKNCRELPAVLVFVLALVGCTGPGGMGQKEATGTAVGCAGGAAVGAAVTHGNAAGILIATVVGCRVGESVGAIMDAQDNAALKAEQRQAFLMQPDNAPSTWQSNHSGATATVVASNSRVETRQVSIVRDAQVAPPPPLDLINARYTAKTTVSVHLAPSPASGVVTSLSKGSSIWAVGKVQGQAWVMVAQKGKSIGYVAASDVRPAPAVAKPTPTTYAAAQPVPSAPTSQAYDLDSDAPVRAPADLDALGPAVATSTVTASVSCRDVTTTAKAADGQTATDKQTACKSPDGSWELN